MMNIFKNAMAAIKYISQNEVVRILKEVDKI